jgi:hypothetical protein
MWQRAFVLEHLAEITAIDPATAGRTSDEVFGLVRRRVTEPLPQVSAARKADHQHRCLQTSCDVVQLRLHC